MRRTDIKDTTDSSSSEIRNGSLFCQEQSSFIQHKVIYKSLSDHRVKQSPFKGWISSSVNGLQTEMTGWKTENTLDCSLK